MDLMLKVKLIMQRNVRLTLLSLVTCLYGLAANAADLPSRAVLPVAAPAPVPAFSWTGIYAGGALGWVQIDPAAGSNKNGLIYGGFAGYNYQAGQWVLGIEGGIEGWTVGDLRYTDLTGDFLTGHSRWGGTIRGRAGYTFDRVLLFATGGAAFISEKASIPGTGVAVGGDGMRSGWTAGAGIDYALTNNWFTGVEYRYSQYDMGSLTTTIPLVGVRTFDHELSTNQVTARLGYKF